MTEIITNNDHEDILHQIINDAEKFIIFACPFWYTQERPDETIFSIFDEEIESALKRDVNILLICNPDFLERLRTYYYPLYVKYNKKIKVYSLENFYSSYGITDLKTHGKVYLNERECLVTSQNITGLNRSYDIGVYSDEQKLHMEVLVWIGELLWMGDSYRVMFFEKMLEGTYFGDFLEWLRSRNND